MSEVKFRYNKYSEFILYFMIISSIIAGFFIYVAIINYSGIAKGTEYTPVYFKKYKEHAVYLIFGLIPIFMLFPA